MGKFDKSMEALANIADAMGEIKEELHENEEDVSEELWDDVTSAGFHIQEIHDRIEGMNS